MSKVLVTGHGVGQSLGLCEACNLNFSWLAQDPCIVMWAEKILLPKHALDAFLKRTSDKYSQALQLALSLFADNNLIETYDASEIFSEEYAKKCRMSAENDSDLILERFSEVATQGSEDVPGEIFINGISYCQPYIASLYASMELARHFDSKCLFGRRDYNFLKYKYGLRPVDKVSTMNAAVQYVQ